MGRRDPGAAQAAPALGLLFGDDNLAFAGASFGQTARLPVCRIELEKIVKFCAQAGRRKPRFDARHL
jgi:hypothetical protein